MGWYAQYDTGTKEVTMAGYIVDPTPWIDGSHGVSVALDVEIPEDIIIINSPLPPTYNYTYDPALHTITKKP